MHSFFPYLFAQATLFKMPKKMAEEWKSSGSSSNDININKNNSDNNNNNNLSIWLQQMIQQVSQRVSEWYFYMNACAFSMSKILDLSLTGKQQGLQIETNGQSVWGKNTIKKRITYYCEWKDFFRKQCGLRLC